MVIDQPQAEILANKISLKFVLIQVLIYLDIAACYDRKVIMKFSIFASPVAVLIN